MKRLGPYEVGHRLGTGAMGNVYKATDRRNGTILALKVLHPDHASEKEGRGRFLREAEILRRIDHDHCARVLDAGEAEIDARRTFFIAMEFAPGRNLLERSMREDLSPVAVAEIGRQAALGLAAAHAVGVVHRDLKPSNIMVSRQGFVKILDFGLAKEGGAAPGGSAFQSMPGVVLGTAAYSAPEQLAGAPEPRSDLYSLGVVLYQLLTGRLPFGGRDTLDVRESQVKGPPPTAHELSSDVDAGLGEIVQELLATDPRERPTAAELAERLEAWSESWARTESDATECEQPPDDEAASAGEVVPQEPTARRWVPWIFGAIVILVIVAFVLWGG